LSEGAKKILGETKVSEKNSEERRRRKMKAYCSFCHQDNEVKLNKALEKAVCTVCTRTVEVAPMMLNLLRESKDFVYYENTQETLDVYTRLAKSAIDKKGVVKRIGKLIQVNDRIFADFDAFVEALRKEDDLRAKIQAHFVL
jgi:hypothetical protein